MFFWLNKILQGLKMASQTIQNIRNGWAPEIKRLNDNLEKLEASLSGTDECVLDIYSLEETLQDKIYLLDAELTTIKADIADLKDHLTSSMYSYLGPGSDVTQTGSDVITVISCRFTACFPTGSDVITQEVTS